MHGTLDHVPFAWHELDEITAEFEQLGLAPEYGGRHGNGVTHMAVLGFDDRSYVELIAAREDADEADHGFWPAHIRNDAGPAAWCVRVPEIVAECKRILDAGYPVRGPLYGARERDDGVLVEWDRAVFGTDDDRLVLPFAIEDRTPLPYRVSPSPSVAGGPLTGVEQVVLAVRDLDATAEQFRNLYRFPRPVRESVDGLGTVASFPGQPVALASPDDENWLDERLAQFPECPCTCLLGTDDLGAACEEYALGAPESWPDGRVAFFDSDLLGRRLGVVERASR